MPFSVYKRLLKKGTSQKIDSGHKICKNSELFRVLNVGSKHLCLDAHSFVPYDIIPDTLLNNIHSMIKTFTYKEYTVCGCRLLSLKSGSVIPFHRDCEFEPNIRRLHIPIHTNSSCYMIYTDYTPDEANTIIGNTISAKELFYGSSSCDDMTLYNLKLKTIIETKIHLTHAVFNNGSTDRIHLVIDFSENT